MAISTDHPAEPDDVMDVDTEAEFPTDWHRDAHIAALQREVDGATLRGDDKQAENAQKELDRLTSKKGGASAEKRPRGAAAEKRAG